MSVDFLVGSTGFVGSNLTEQHKFSALFSSVNIKEAYDMRPDLLVYAGVPSEMFTANEHPDEDMRIIDAAEQNISRIAPHKLVLISTAAVYPDPSGCTEDTAIDEALLLPYGANRLALERWAERNIHSCLIVRLPALFGKNLRKNFIYDIIHKIPPILTEAKFMVLSGSAPELAEYYSPHSRGFMKCREISRLEEDKLRQIFCTLGFSSVNFTDSRSAYQFYPLKYLWQHISTALSRGLKRLNLATPPLSAAEVYRFLTGRKFVNELTKPPFSYDIRTKHYELFGGKNGYIMSREQELADLREFVREAGL